MRCRRRQNKAVMKEEVDHLKHCVVCNLEHVLEELLKNGDSLHSLYTQLQSWV